jgi:F0F1-type ATP synthase membrane subunit c/vacuolar-type H+-ATPase subunit K
MLAVAGIGLLYLLSRMIIGDIRQEDTLSWWILGVAMTASLWLVALGSMLAKAELTDWK